MVGIAEGEGVLLGVLLGVGELDGVWEGVAEAVLVVDGVCDREDLRWMEAVCLFKPFPGEMATKQ